MRPSCFLILTFLTFPASAITLVIAANMPMSTWSTDGADEKQDFATRFLEAARADVRLRTRTTKSHLSKMLNIHCLVFSSVCTFILTG
jgi:hypothetical protein